MTGCSTAVYEPRRPEKTAFYRAVSDNLDLFYERYDDRFLDQHGPLSARAVKTLDGFLRCGRLCFG